jgi:hypothetical protein
MKCAAAMDSVAMIHIPSFIKTGFRHSKVGKERFTDKQDGDRHNPTFGK